MLADLAHQRLAVMLGHPVLGLDEFTCRNPRFESCFALRVLVAGGLHCQVLLAHAHCLCVHDFSSSGLGTLIDHAPGLADQRAFNRIGRTDTDFGRDADQRLDPVLQRPGNHADFSADSFRT